VRRQSAEGNTTDEHLCSKPDPFGVTPPRKQPRCSRPRGGRSDPRGERPPARSPILLLSVREQNTFRGLGLHRSGFKRHRVERCRETPPTQPSRLIRWASELARAGWAPAGRLACRRTVWLPGAARAQLLSPAKRVHGVGMWNLRSAHLRSRSRPVTAYGGNGRAPGPRPPERSFRASRRHTLRPDRCPCQRRQKR
jgi:hypothetical protein